MIAIFLVIMTSNQFKRFLFSRPNRIWPQAFDTSTSRRLSNHKPQAVHNI